MTLASISPNTPLPNILLNKAHPIAVTLFAGMAAYLIAAIAIPHFHETPPVIAVTPPAVVAPVVAVTAPSVAAEPVAIPTPEITPEPAHVRPVAPRASHQMVRHVHHWRKIGCECVCHHVSRLATRAAPVAALQDARPVPPLTLADAVVHLFRSLTHKG
jgi:hypothetical protein